MRKNNNNHELCNYCMILMQKIIICCICIVYFISSGVFMKITKHWFIKRPKHWQFQQVLSQTLTSVISCEMLLLCNSLQHRNRFPLTVNFTELFINSKIVQLFIVLICRRECLKHQVDKTAISLQNSSKNPCLTEGH